MLSIENQPLNANYSAFFADSFSEDFIKENSNKNLFDIVDSLKNEISRLDELAVSLYGTATAYVTEINFKEYRNHISQFLYFLNFGIIPEKTEENGLKRFETIIRSLVQKGSVSERALTFIK